MNPASAEKIDQARDRRTLLDLAVMTVWAAGFFGTVRANDGVMMSICLSLMTLSATWLAFHGSRRPAADGRRRGASLRRIARVAAWVTLGPLIAAFMKLQVMGGITRVSGDFYVLAVMFIVLVVADRFLAESS